MSFLHDTCANKQLHFWCILQDYPRLNYTARVEANTGFPPGYKEDQFAKCNYQNMIVGIFNPTLCFALSIVFVLIKSSSSHF